MQPKTTLLLPDLCQSSGRSGLVIGARRRSRLHIPLHGCRWTVAANRAAATGCSRTAGRRSWCSSIRSCNPKRSSNSRTGCTPPSEVTREPWKSTFKRGERRAGRGDWVSHPQGRSLPRSRSFSLSRMYWRWRNHKPTYAERQGVIPRKRRPRLIPRYTGCQPECPRARFGTKASAG